MNEIERQSSSQKKYNLNGKKKVALIRRIRAAFQIYNENILGHSYSLFDNNKIIHVQFNKSNFAHLCGIEHTLPNDTCFYQALEKGWLQAENIKSVQKKNITTLHHKLKTIYDIHQTLQHMETQDVYLAKNYKTRSKTFPYAIINKTNHFVLGLVTENDRDYLVRSIRNYKTDETLEKTLDYALQEQDSQIHSIPVLFEDVWVQSARHFQTNRLMYANPSLDIYDIVNNQDTQSHMTQSLQKKISEYIIKQMDYKDMARMDPHFVAQIPNVIHQNINPRNLVLPSSNGEKHKDKKLDQKY